MPVEPHQSTVPTTPPGAGMSVVGWIRDGFVDAELAALVWLLIDGRVPVIVASPEDAPSRAAHVGALAGLLAAEQPTAMIAQASDVAGLADAGELGWLAEVAPEAGGTVEGPAADGDGASRPSPIHPGTVLLADDLGPGLGRRWRAATRVLVRSLSRGFGLVSSVSALSLEEVLASLRSMQVGLREDELSYLGVVLVVGRDEVAAVAGDAVATAVDASAARSRITIAHYARPVARDAHGHVQRLGPAVLTSWDAGRGEWEHFAWGIYPELAARVGSRAGDFEHEHIHRTQYLAGLARAGVTDPSGVRSALDLYRRDMTLGRQH